jgi:ribosomal protein L29
MKSREFLTEIRGLNAEDLAARAGQISEEMMKLRFRKAGGQNEHSARIALLRRNFARVQTLLKARGKEAGSKETAAKKA